MSLSAPESTIATGYAEHTLDEVWTIGDGTRLSNRVLTRGAAFTSHHAGGWSIESTTDFSAPPANAMAERLLSLAVLESHRDAVLDRIGSLPGPLSIRIVLSHRLDGVEETLTTVIRVEAVRDAGATLALLTTPHHIVEDIERLERLRTRPVDLERRDLEALPLLWRNGTGGVLLHESAGHPAGITPPIDWPAWLQVLDDPGKVSFEVPINHRLPGRQADLLASQPPASLRRASFREHPMPRMSSLVALIEDAPFELPDRHIEIELAEGGTWDPLTHRISVRVLSAALVEGKRRRGLAPFAIIADRTSVARSLKGSRGEAVRYPGVLCSDHGQRLPVGTFAPDLITEGI